MTENGTVTYTYFADGLMESKLDAKSQRLWYVYDSSHRLLRIESPQGTTKTSFTYDTTANQGMPTTNATGRMTSAANDGYAWHFGYDKMGRVLKQTMQATVSGTDYYAQAQYAYDGDGRLQDVYYPGAFTTFVGSVAPATQYRTSYDLAGRPTGLTHLDNGNWITDVQNVAYNAASQLTQWQEAGGTLTRSYSLSGAWHERASRYRISVKREAHGTVSRLLHDEYEVGDVLEALPPAGDFTLRERSNAVVLASSGVGITPMIAMLETMDGIQRAGLSPTLALESKGDWVWKGLPLDQESPDFRL